MELRQSLVVSYVGKGQAMLIFSDFFEEAVENTPARILVTNTSAAVSSTAMLLYAPSSSFMSMTAYFLM